MRHRDRVLEEKERVALFFARHRGEHSRVAPQVLCPAPWGIGRGLIVRAHGQGYAIRIKVVTVLHSSFFCSFKRVGLLTRLGCVQGLRWSVS